MGLEPTTTRLRVVRSAKLSYASMWCGVEKFCYKKEEKQEKKTEMKKKKNTFFCCVVMRVFTGEQLELLPPWLPKLGPLPSLAGGRGAEGHLSLPRC